MTVFGKILTFIILVLALAQAALHIMFHIAQTNYAEANRRQDAALTAANATIDATRHDLETVKQESQALLAKRDDDLKLTNEQLNLVKGDVQKKDQQIITLNGQIAAEQAKGAAFHSNVQARDQEVVRMDGAVRARDEKILELIKTGNELRQLKVKAEIEAKAFKDRNEQLVETLVEKEKEIVRMRTTSFDKGFAGQIPGGAGGMGPVTAAAKNPPPDNVEGLITRTDPNTGMVTISIGTDAGVVKGHTLEVFRLNPPKYLGTIRIVDTRPNEAVGKPVNKPLGQILQGDRVAAKILGG